MVVIFERARAQVRMGCEVAVAELDAGMGITLLYREFEAALVPPVLARE
ncbi:hypothetical protein NX786_02240 [Telluria mixta]|uniref:Uncharacterized protein n=1 Tax=Telluria mixta TaxID=34071 RepID=A0ABT2BSQ7_9BURK|nr:hypothetical protein [Telluria mixta]MCS0628163.1 hypothetical protein [Telluria mixta]WEM93721.1 hypothetical protein P0M04_19750 [Telluria mixta]